MSMEDLVCVTSFTVTVSIPTVVDQDGKRVEVPSDIVEKAGKELSEELEELNFAELLKTTGQTIAEEQFLKYRPIVDVSVGD